MDSSSPTTTEALAADDAHHVGSAFTMTWPLALLGLGTLMLVCILTLITFDNWGRSVRNPPDGSADRQLITASSGVEAIVKLEAAGLRGIYLIQLTTNEAFAPVEFASAVATDAGKPGHVYPAPAVDVEQYFVQSLNSENYMLVAARTGLARKVDQVLPPSTFERARKSLLAEGDSAITVTVDSIRMNAEGEVRHLLPSIPSTEEDFVLLVNASYFSEVSPQKLASDLRPFASRISYIAVSTDEDDNWVDDAARQRAMEFTELIVRGSL